MELQSREEEIRFLRMEAADLRRQIDLLKGSLPNKQALDRELTTLQLQLSQCQDYICDLERSLEDSSNVDRVRFLHGNDPAPTDLSKKIEKVCCCIIVGVFIFVVVVFLLFLIII